MHALSQTTGYAIRALSCLGDSDGEWMLSGEIARRTGVPKPYLSKILHALARAGLIRSKRGYRGGVALSRPAAQMSLMDVAQAVEPLEKRATCLLGWSHCSDERACPVHNFWKIQRQEIEQELSRVTLAEVAAFEAQQERRRQDETSLSPRLASGMQGRAGRIKPTSRFLRHFAGQ